MKTIFQCCLPILACLTVACHDQTESVSTETEPVVEENVTPQWAKPDRPGVYLNYNQTFVELFRGNLDDLQTTNADRGFGFLTPVGQRYAGDNQVWTVWNRRLNPNTLQITRMDGAVILSDDWVEDVSNENVAWLPAYSVPLEIRQVSKNDPIVHLTATEPLTPGFYVLHDDSFVRARHKNEVAAYYPFLITDDNSVEMLWQRAAENCFTRLFEKYDSQFNGKVDKIGELKACAEQNVLSQRLSRDESKRALFQNQRLFLASNARVSFNTIETKIFDKQDLQGDALERWFWKRAKFSILMRLQSLHDRLVANAESGANTPYQDYLPSLYRYYLATENPTQQGLEGLFWIPFSALSPDDAQLKALFSALTTNEDWRPRLTTLLGAVEWRKIASAVENNPEFEPWFKAMSPDVVAAFKDIAAKIALRDEPATLTIGPFEVSQLPPEDQLSVVQKVTKRAKALESCARGLERRLGKRNATLIFEFNFDTSLGAHTTTRLIDPFAETRRVSTPVVDAEFTQCVRQNLTEITVTPSLTPVLHASFALTIHAQKQAPWQK